MRHVKPSLLLSCAMLLASSAFATTIDTGPGPDYGGGSSLNTEHDQFPYHQSLAGKFTLSGTEQITAVAGWLNWNYAGQLDFSIATDAAGVPGSLLYTATVDVPVTPINHPDWRGASQLSWHVGAGDYWLVISVPGNQSAFGSMPQGPVDHPLEAYAADWTYSNGFAVISGAQYGMRITTSAVPEPADMALLLAGLAVVMCRVRATRPGKTV
jgi:hypothetical protein